ncbi:MAG TPA: tetratricopeptide repeat protein [Pyrinomonadaceae bacterium]|jgi:tetratricopeptide (TPR) repeat protein
MNQEKCLRARSLRATLLVLLAIVAFNAAACTNPEQAKAEHVKQGEAYLQDKKYQEASIEFRNAIQIDGNLAAAHWGLAQAYEGLQRFGEAAEELQITLQRDPNHLDARLKLANYYLVSYNFNQKGELLGEAERLANEIMERDANHIDGNILMANVLHLRGKNGEALARLNRAIELNPQRIESHLGLARFYMQTNDAGKAEEAFRRALSINNAASLAHVEYGKFLVQTNRLDEAERSFQKAVEVDPTNRDVRLVLASFYLVNKRMDKAEDSYKALAELDRDKPEGRAILADYYATVGRFDDAVNIYKEAVAKAPDFARGRYRLGELMLQRGDVRGAEEQVKDILQKNAGDMQARLLNARILLRKGDHKKAIDDLKEVLKQDAHMDVALYYMAEANYNSGKMDDARSAAADLERYHPDFLPGRLMQVQIALASGDAKTAERLGTELLERLRTATPTARMTPTLIDELRAKTLTARGTANLQLRNTAAARADMSAARDAMPDSPASYTNLAAVAFTENKQDEAAQLYERALSIDNANYDALAGLINIHRVRNRLGDAHARVDQALSAQPNNAALHFLKSQIYGFEGNAQGAEASLRRTLELDAAYIPAYQALASLYFNMKQPERAIAEYRKITERQPDNAGAHTLMGMVEYSRNNYDAAVESYRRAIQIDPESTFAANNLAMVIADHGKGNLDEAVQLAQGVVRRFPDEPGYADTLGWVYYKKGLYSPAVEQLQKAVAKASARGGDNALYRYHFGLALAGAGKKADARRELQTAQRLAGQEASRGKQFAQADDLRKALESL